MTLSKLYKSQLYTVALSADRVLDCEGHVVICDYLMIIGDNYQQIIKYRPVNTHYCKSARGVFPDGTLS